VSDPISQRPSFTFAARSKPFAWFRGATGRRRLKVALVILIGLVAFFAMILGLSTVVAEHQAGVRRERFQQEGTPVVETIKAKKAGRRYRYLIIAPPGTIQFQGEPQSSDGRWVRVYRPAFERFQVGDAVDFLKIGDDYLVRDDEFYSRFIPWVCFLVSAACVAAILVVLRLGKLRE
jgi:hypothetical protein